MSEELKNQIFLPFFTTKDVHEGTGLGLAVVHGIVAAHGGEIAVETEEGKGTKFLIHLPLESQRIIQRKTRMKNAKERERILIVDDSPATLEMLERNLRSEGYEVLAAPGVAEAIRILDDTPTDLVITDYKMPETSGMDLIRYVRENLKNTEVMMITGYATVEGAVDAIKAGAEEYLTKPFTDEELFSAVRRALDKLKLRIAIQDRLPQTISSRYGLLGESEPMNHVLGAIAKAASTPATVLITGQSGTGKELVARAIHYSSKRASAPFVPVNCGGIPETLLESELFGYVKGAFTGALESRAGFFQTADGGTIFLDEVSETSLAMQVKLLRVLQEKEVCMVGSTQPRKVNVRILAATNKNLLSLVKKGSFREDLLLSPERDRDRHPATSGPG